MSRHLLTAQFDAATELKDAGAVTSSGAAQVASVNRVVNVGKGLLQAVVIIDVDTIDITTGDEAYEVRIQGSTSPTFADNVHNLAVVKLGDSTVTGESADSVIGRKTVPFVNTADGSSPLPYIRAYHTAAGTTPSVNYRAFITKNPTA